MTIVFKLGGSLLTLPDLASRFNEALNQRFGENCLIIPGGGASADLVREWSQIYKLNDESAHWLAIASLDFNNRLLQRLLKCESVTCRDEADLIWANQSSPLLLSMERFVTVEELRLGKSPEIGPDRQSTDWDHARHLPHTWETSSDSLAAWTAIRWPASELILLKSIPAPIGLSAKQASELNLVDAQFPCLASQVPRISWCNLRETPVVVKTWLETHRKQ